MHLNLKLSGLALGLAAALGLASAMPASAQDQWDGFYFGKHVGYGTAHREGCTSYSFTLYAPESCDYGSGPIEINTDYAGWLIGKQAGVNFQSSNIVFGVEIAASWVNLDSIDQFDGINGIDWIVTGTGRVGFTTGNVLFYGEAGIGAAAFNYGPNGAGCEFNSILTGLVLGGGIEALLGDNVSIFGEVNHIGFQPSQASCNNIDSGAWPSSFSDTQTSALLFKVGVNWHAN